MKIVIPLLRGSSPQRARVSGNQVTYVKELATLFALNVSRLEPLGEFSFDLADVKRGRAVPLTALPSLCQEQNFLLDKVRAVHSSQLISREATSMAKKAAAKAKLPRWCTGGVLLSKSESRVSSKQLRYQVWTITDMGTTQFTLCDVVVTREVYSRFRKVKPGDLICVVSAQLKQTKQGVSLMVRTPSQISIAGHCPQLGKCREDKCNVPVDLDHHTLCKKHSELKFNKRSSVRMEFNSGLSYVPASKAARNSGKDSNNLSGRSQGGKRKTDFRGGGANKTSSKQQRMKTIEDVVVSHRGGLGSRALSTTIGKTELSVDKDALTLTKRSVRDGKQEAARRGTTLHPGKRSLYGTAADAQQQPAETKKKRKKPPKFIELG